jgi:hypothetical protein
LAIFEPTPGRLHKPTIESGMSESKSAFKIAENTVKGNPGMIQRQSVINKEMKVPAVLCKYSAFL